MLSIGDIWLLTLLTWVTIDLTGGVCYNSDYTVVTNATMQNKDKCTWIGGSNKMTCVNYCTQASDCFAYAQQGSGCFACLNNNGNLILPDPSNTGDTLHPDTPVLEKMDVNECEDPQYCKNGASCVDAQFQIAHCVCVPGYTDTYCQTDIDDCEMNNCQNGATCVDAVNTYTCTCVLGYGGNLCQTNINDCLPNPCTEGTCTDLLNDFTCTCPGWRSGSTCQSLLYEIPASGQSYSSAKSKCTASGKHLVKIDSSAELNIIKTMLDTSSYFSSVRGSCLMLWMSGVKSGGTWKWYDGSTNGYWPWAPGEGGGSGQDCTAFMVGSGISDLSRLWYYDDVICGYSGTDVCPFCEV